jgi:UPF0716 protein FxsA
MARLLVAGLILAEIASLIVVGRVLGVLLALLLVVLAAVLGTAILRRQGSEALARMRGSLQGRRDPRPALLAGGFRFMAALLLILPGFLSDVVALALLLPPIQQALARALARRGMRVVQGRTMPFEARPARPEPPRDQVVDADWEEIPPPKRPTHRPSGWTRH